MVISEFLKEGSNQKCRPRKLQVKCDLCFSEYNIIYTNQKIGFKKYNKDLCRSCKQIEQYKSGDRTKDQCYKGGRAAKLKMKGKTNKELYDNDKFIVIKEKISKHSKGINNNMYGKKYHTHGIINYGKLSKNKSLDEIYGIEKSLQIKNKISLSSSGKNNPMYGKPSPIGSGNGWSGWYKGWYFRSLRELSYMINIIEKFNLKWEKAEKSKFKIFYLDFNNKLKTYYPDFLINNKYLIEIKPKKLHNSKVVQLKKKAAEKFCKENNFIYKLRDISILSNQKILELYQSKEIKFLERYDEKFKNKYISS